MTAGLYHPDEATLADYAAGTLGDGMSLLVAAHMTYCHECRRTVETMESAGGVSLKGCEPVPMSADAATAALALIDTAPSFEEEQTPEPTCSVDDRVPLVLQRVLDDNLDNLSWQFCLPGLHQHSMSGFDGEDVALIRARPGAQMLPHTHTGDEATLILAGAMHDGDVVYRVGDVAQADHDDDHRPKIVGEKTCYCLIVMSGGMHFTGRFSRALNLFNRAG